MGSEAVHRIQHKLHLLDPNIFPLLDEEGVVVDKTVASSPAIFDDESRTEKAAPKQDKVAVIACEDLKTPCIES